MNGSMWRMFWLNPERTRGLVIRTIRYPRMEEPPVVEGLYEKTRVPKRRWLR